MNGEEVEGRAQPQGRLAAAGSTVLERAGITLTGSVIGGFLVLVNEALIAQFLGIQIYGLYALAFMFAKVGAILSSFGLSVTVLYFLPINLSQQDRPRAVGTILGSVFLPSLIGCVFSSAVWLSSDWFSNRIFHEPGAAPFIRGLALAVPFLALSEVLGHLARGFGRSFPYVLIRNLTLPACYFLIILYLRHTDAPAVDITEGLLTAAIVSFLVGVFYIISLTRKTVGWVKPIFDLKALYAYALPVLLNLVASLVIASSAIFLIGVYSTAEAAGLYRACMQLVIPFELILIASAATMAPAYSVLVHDRLHDRLRISYLGAVHLVTLLALPLFLLLLFNGEDILGLLGSDFTVAATSMSILAFGHLATACVGNASVLLTMGQKQRLEAANCATAALFNVAFNLFLIPRFGLIGAAIGTAASLLVLAALRITQVRRVFGLTTLDMTVARVVVVTASAAALSYWASASMGLGIGTGPVNLIIRFALMGVSIAFSVWRLCLDKEERDLLLRVVKT